MPQRFVVVAVLGLVFQIDSAQVFVEMRHESSEELPLDLKVKTGKNPHIENEKSNVWEA